MDSSNIQYMNTAEDPNDDPNVLKQDYPVLFFLTLREAKQDQMVAGYADGDIKGFGDYADDILKNNKFAVLISNSQVKNSYGGE